jgi:hypothetical protein
LPEINDVEPLPFGTCPMICEIGRPGCTRNSPNANPNPAVAGLKLGNGSDSTLLCSELNVVWNVQVRLLD